MTHSSHEIVALALWMARAIEEQYHLFRTFYYQQRNQGSIQSVLKHWRQIRVARQVIVLILKENDSSQRR
jgi:hypothetical protein